MYKLFKSSKDSDDLSMGFHRSSAVREEEIKNEKPTGKYQAGVNSRDVFGLAEHQGNAKHGLG